MQTNSIRQKIRVFAINLLYVALSVKSVFFDKQKSNKATISSSVKAFSEISNCSAIDCKNVVTMHCLFYILSSCNMCIKLQPAVLD